MRGKIIATTSFLKKHRQERLKTLQAELKQLQRDHKDTLDSRKNQEIKRVKNQIDEIYTQEYQKKLIFLKQRYYEVGSKSMKILSYRLCKEQAYHAIHKIRNPKTKIFQHGLKDIKQTFELFYKNYINNHT